MAEKRLGTMTGRTEASWPVAFQDSSQQAAEEGIRLLFKTIVNYEWYSLTGPISESRQKLNRKKRTQKRTQQKKRRKLGPMSWRGVGKPKF
jgi:hypothetical protein